MNENKIAFVINVKSIENYEKCVEFLQQLIMPESFTAEVIALENCANLGYGYNQIQKENDAMYKVYMADDVFIVNPNFIEDVIDIFDSNFTIGMVGIVGEEKFIPSLNIEKMTSDIKRYRFGKYYDSDLNEVSFGEVSGKYKQAAFLKYGLVITNRDIEWNGADNFGEDLLIMAQCAEYQKNGYISAVAAQKNPWAIADSIGSGSINIKENEREIFLKKYSKDIFPLISILIPTYNRPHYLDIALESAVKQTYYNTEIIIGDDNAGDVNLAVIEKYQKQYDNITYYHNKPKKGCSMMRRSIENFHNILKKSKGEYINYLLDDDVFALNKLEVMMDAYLLYPNVALVSSFRQFIDKDGNPIKMGHWLFDNAFSDKNSIVDGRSMVNIILINNVINMLGEVTTNLIKREHIGNTLGEYNGESFMSSADLSQWLASLRHGDLFYFCDTLSYMRQHENQKSSDKGKYIFGWTEETVILFKAYEEGYFLGSDEEFLKVLYMRQNKLAYYEKYSVENEYLKSNMFNMENYRRFKKMKRKMEELIAEKENAGISVK
jgi:glycosyltransferase involved in cell wall biosynthesis